MHRLIWAIVGGGAVLLALKGTGRRPPAGTRCSVVIGPPAGSGARYATVIYTGQVQGGRCMVGGQGFALSDPRVRIG
jgi:hypothetical protein